MEISRYTVNAPHCRCNFVKLTKTVLNEFISWTTSRYNDYLGFGTKKEAVDKVFHSFINGYFTSVRFKKDKSKIDNKKEDITLFIIECASPVGENSNGKARGRGARNSYWKTKTSGDEYMVDCKNLIVHARYSKRVIKFSN